MRGYMPDFSRSLRAQAAEDEGALPASRITASWLRAGGIDLQVSFVRWLIRTGQVQAHEWHHTGAYFRETDYHSVSSIREELESLDMARALRFWQLPAGQRPKNEEDWRHLMALAVMGRPHPLWRASS